MIFAAFTVIRPLFARGIAIHARRFAQSTGLWTIFHDRQRIISTFYFTPYFTLSRVLIDARRFADATAARTFLQHEFGIFVTLSASSPLRAVYVLVVAGERTYLARLRAHSMHELVGHTLVLRFPQFACLFVHFVFTCGHAYSTRERTVLQHIFRVCLAKAVVRPCWAFKCFVVTAYVTDTT